MTSTLTSDVGQLWFMFPQSSVPLLGQLGSASDRLVPHNREVCLRGKVLGDSDGGVQVEDYVPPASGDKDCLPRMLDGLDGPEPHWPVRGLGLGIDDTEPGDRLVPLLPALAGLDCDELLGGVRGEEAPALVSGDERVPGGGAQRVDVYPSARSARSDDNPSVWRPLGFSAVFEKVICEIFGKLIIF